MRIHVLSLPVLRLPVLRFLVLSLLVFGSASAALAEPPDAKTNFVGLVKVGQSATYSYSDGTYSIRVFSKQKKLELLKQHHQRLEAFEEHIAELRRDELRVPVAGRPRLSLYRIVRVGPDFIGLARSETETIFVPTWSIRSLVFEKSEKEVGQVDDGLLEPAIVTD